MKSSNFRQLIILIAAAVVWTIVQCWLLNSPAGFSTKDLEAASPGLKGLMGLMMNWWSVLVVGLPTGFGLFGLCKLLRINF